jgi:hypothetical protein
MKNHDPFLQERIVEWKTMTLSSRKGSWVEKPWFFPEGKDHGRKISGVSADAKASWFQTRLREPVQREICAKSRKFLRLQPTVCVEPIATTKFSFVHFSFSTVSTEYRPLIRRPIQFLRRRRSYRSLGKHFRGSQSRKISIVEIGSGIRAEGRPPFSNRKNSRTVAMRNG